MLRKRATSSTPTRPAYFLQRDSQQDFRGHGLAIESCRTEHPFAEGLQDRDQLSARAIRAKRLLAGSHLFGIEAAEQCCFSQPSISSQKNAAVWSIFAPLQGGRQL